MINHAKTLRDLLALRRTYMLCTVATAYALMLGSDLEARVALSFTVLVWTLCLSALQADIKSARTQSVNPRKPQEVSK